MQINAIIETQKLCNKNNDDTTCYETIFKTAKAFASKAHYNRNFTIVNEKNTIVWHYVPEKSPKDTVAGSDIQLYLPANIANTKLKYSTYFDIPAFFHSVIKSMTFSASDIFIITYDSGLKEAINSFDKSYWYRSRPAIGFAIFSFLILLIYKKREEHLIRKQDENEREIIRKFKEEFEKISSNV